MRGVRADAPWCPSNIEFIRRINGLDSIDEVKRIVFDATYLVLGLGDVYLGAPVATPVDPRHRLVTTKYNPARTWTPDNVVGIGGAYLCIYGMEGPGGYQLFGRTCQMWNTYRVTDAFEPGKPWLLRFFDQIRFYPVSGEELARISRRVSRGQAPHRNRFRRGSASRDYRRFRRTPTPRRSPPSRRASRPPSMPSGRAGKRRAQTESVAAGDDAADFEADGALPPGATAVESPVPGSVWKILVEPGREVSEGETLIIVESMKMEIAVCAPSSGLRARGALRRGPVGAARPGAGDHGGRCMTLSLDIADLERLYADGEATPEDIVREVYARIGQEASGLIGSRSSRRMRPSPRRAPRREGRLYGIPFAVKDNIDVAGLPTTCACPEFAYVAERSATVVELLGAGRRHPDRQDQSRPVRHRPERHPLALRHPGERVQSRLHFRRLELRLGGRRRCRPCLLRARHRHGGLGPRAGRLQQHRRAEADQGPDQHARRGAGLQDARRGLDLCSDRRRRGESGNDRNRLRQGGSFRTARGAVLCRRSRAATAESGCAKRTDPVFRR